MSPDVNGVTSQRGTTLVDLSCELFNGMPAHALFPSPIILPYVDHLQAKAAGLGVPGDPMTYAINYISMLEHCGTHVDAPYHIGEHGTTVDRLSLDWFTGKAVVLDLTHVNDRDRRTHRADVLGLPREALAQPRNGHEQPGSDL